MKTFIATITVALGLSTAATAGELAWVGSTEYAVEAETFAVEAGVEYGMGAFTVAPLLFADDVAGDFEFTGAELAVTYGLNGNIDLYGVVAADADFDYDELTIGASFKF